MLQVTGNPEHAPALDDDKSTASRHGVFYPTGYVVAAYKSQELAESTFKALDRQAPDGVARLISPNAMLELVNESVENAGVLAKIVSAELKQVEVLRQFAEAGHSFVIFARDSVDEKWFDKNILGSNPQRLVHYAMLAIQDMTPGKSDIPGISPFGVNERERTG